MKNLFCVVLLAAAGLCGSAYAAAYDDFARALSAYNQGNIEAAIAGFSSALADGDLSVKLRPAAHIGRAKAYLRKSSCADAVTDLSAALAVQPRDATALVLRASAYSCVGKMADAETDVDAALEIAPDATLYFDRGRLRWTRGQFSDAAADFAQTTRLNPSWLYGALWLADAERRSHAFDAKAFGKTLPDFSSREWPGPILAYYLGERSSDDVYSAAARADASVKASQKCEADYYIGEWQVAQGNAADGKRLLQSAADNCPHNFVEFTAAQAELKRAP
ncbi:MAG TPA: tetratricopeptide repeat protein [Rhizomicrobium sp.]